MAKTKQALINEDIPDENMQDGVDEGVSAEQDPASTVTAKKEADILDASIEKQITAMGRRTAEKLRKEPKGTIIVPEDQLNPEESYVVVGINGWNFQIQRKVPVVLPETVIDLLARGGYNPTRVK